MTIAASHEWRRHAGSPTAGRLRPWLLALAVAVTAASPAFSQDETPGWPRTIEAQGYVITVYQPQTDRFGGDTLEGRVAVSVRRATGSGEPVFGAAWFSARLDINAATRVARVRRITIPQVRFAESTEAQRSQLARLLEQEVPRWDLAIDLDRLVPDLDHGAAVATTPGLKHDPPRFAFSNEPAVLVLFDGKPVAQAVDGNPDLQRIVNTPFPISRERNRGPYYLFGGGSLWYSAAEPLGPWTVTKAVPPPVARLVEGAETAEAFADAAEAAPPRIITATEPTELIVTDGEPRWAPLGDGDLLYCDNTPADVFLEIASQRYFILVGGRWFAGRAVAGSVQWQYVQNDELPEAFSQIPAESPKAAVRLHVAGTVEAREEALENVIPEIAAVKRDAAAPAVNYDGAPKFEPVEQAAKVQYAVNTAAAVFKVGTAYYLCDNGVWFRASSPTGPWTVATEIPSALYTVPPSNPHYNVTYVRVYDVTPKAVYVGYTPGYIGSYWSHGCIVWGTGWRYNPWFGPYYYPYRWTWGLHMTYSPWGGWGFGVSWSNGPFRITVGWRSGPYYRPPYYGGWYGPGGYRPPYRPYPPPGYRPPGYRPIPTPYAGRPGGPMPVPARPNLYDRPGVSDRMAPGAKPAARPRPTPAQTPNDVFTDRNGEVFRRNPAGGWDQRQGGQWWPADGLDRPEPATRPGTPGAPGAPTTLPAGRGTGAGAKPERPVQPPTTRPGASGPATRPAPGGLPGQPSIVRPPTGATRPDLERDSRARQRGAARAGQIGGGARGGRRR